MKTSLLLITFLFLTFCNSLFAESDIIWTKPIGSMVRTVKFSPDGRYVYAAAEGYGPLKLDANTGDIIIEYKGIISPNDFRLSADGLKLYAAGGGTQVYIYNTETDRLEDSLTVVISSTDIDPSLNPSILTLGLSSNYLFAHYVYTIKPFEYEPEETVDDELQIYDIKTKTMVKKMFFRSVKNIEVSPDNSFVAFTYYYPSETLWTRYRVGFYAIDSWKWLGECTGHTNTITDLSFSPDGSLLASCDDYVIKIWSLEDKKLSISFSSQGIYTYSLELVNNNLLTIGNGDTGDFKLKTKNLSTLDDVYFIPSIPLDFEYFNNQKVIVANYKEVTLFKADRLSSISFNIGKDKLYPNPSNQNITIPSSYFNENFLYFNIIDMTGNEIYRYDKSNNFNFNADYVLDVSSYLTGSYIIQLFYTTSIQTLKFIKE